MTLAEGSLGFQGVLKTLCSQQSCRLAVRIPFSRWGNWGSEGSDDLPRAPPQWVAGLEFQPGGSGSRTCIFPTAPSLCLQTSFHLPSNSWFNHLCTSQLPSPTKCSRKKLSEKISWTSKNVHPNVWKALTWVIKLRESMLQQKAPLPNWVLAHCCFWMKDRTLHVWLEPRWFCPQEHSTLPAFNFGSPLRRMIPLCHPGSCGHPVVDSRTHLPRWRGAEDTRVSSLLLRLWPL